MTHALKSMSATASRGLFGVAQELFGNALNERLEGGEASACDTDAEFHGGPDERTDIGPCVLRVS